MICQAERTPVSSKGIEAILCFSELIKNEHIFFHLFTSYDSHFFQPNIIGRMLNLISQYAKKEYEGAVTALQELLRMLVHRYIGRGHRNEEWALAGECLKKRELKRAIALFNKKPNNGIKYLKKLFEAEKKEGKAGGQS